MVLAARFGTRWRASSTGCVLLGNSRARGAEMPLHETPPKLKAAQYEANLVHITPPMTPRQPTLETSRCLYCLDAQCTIACPSRIDDPGFCRRIMTRFVREAALVILE